MNKPINRSTLSPGLKFKTTCFFVALFTGPMGYFALVNGYSKGDWKLVLSGVVCLIGSLLSISMVVAALMGRKMFVEVSPDGLSICTLRGSVFYSWTQVADFEIKKIGTSEIVFVKSISGTKRAVPLFGHSPNRFFDEVNKYWKPK